MLQKVKGYIEEFHMLERGDKIVIGVSGGADSVCLLQLLSALSEEFELQLFAVHVEHGIRGEEAVEDMQFVRAYCKSLNVPCKTCACDVPKLSAEWKMSEEETGRKVRYELFEQTAKEWGANKIAVAHHKNDQAETILYHLFRGSGLKGLSGMAPVRGMLIRPLLCVSRREIEDYLKKNRILYRTDSTNAETAYIRNKIRLKLLPFAEKEINSEAVEHIVKAGSYIADAQSFLEKYAQSVYSRLVKEGEENCRVAAEELLREEKIVQNWVLILCIHKLAGTRRNLTNRHIEAVRELLYKESGKRLGLPYHITARKAYGVLVLEQAEGEERSKSEPVFVPSEGEIIEPVSGIKLVFELVNRKKVEKIEENCYTKWFDYDKIKSTVQLRTRQQGDYLCIDGQGSRQKLKSFFINKKIPREDRERIMLLADGNHILWIIGFRVSEAYRVTKETKHIWKVQLCGGKENE